MDSAGLLLISAVGGSGMDGVSADVYRLVVPLPAWRLQLSFNTKAREATT